jgi:hypothetical protein
VPIRPRGNGSEIDDLIAERRAAAPCGHDPTTQDTAGQPGHRQTPREHVTRLTQRVTQQQDTLHEGTANGDHVGEVRLLVPHLVVHDLPHHLKQRRIVLGMRALLGSRTPANHQLQAQQRQDDRRSLIREDGRSEQNSPSLCPTGRTYA